MSEEYLKVSNLSVSKNLYNFINNEALPNSGVSSNQFWRGMSSSLEILVPVNKKFRRGNFKYTRDSTRSAYKQLKVRIKCGKC